MNDWALASPSQLPAQAALVPADPVHRLSPVTLEWQPISAAHWFVFDIGATTAAGSEFRYTLRCGNPVLEGFLTPATPPRTLTLPISGQCNVQTAFTNRARGSGRHRQSAWLLSPR